MEPQEKVLPAQAERPEDGAENRGYLHASDLSGTTVSASPHDEIGFIETVFFDTEQNQLAYVSFAVGEVLGMGGQVKVLPWKAVKVVTKEGDSVVRVPLTKS